MTDESRKPRESIDIPMSDDAPAANLRAPTAPPVSSIYPPSVKPPPLPMRARDIRPAADLKTYELDTSHARSRRAPSVHTAPTHRLAAVPTGGGGWARAAFLLLLLVGVSIAAYVWKGR